MYAARVGLRGMSDPHSNWSDTGAGVGVGPVVSDGLAGGGSSTPVVPPPPSAPQYKKWLQGIGTVEHGALMRLTEAVSSWLVD